METAKEFYEWIAELDQLIRKLEHHRTKLIQHYCAINHVDLTTFERRYMKVQKQGTQP